MHFYSSFYLENVSLKFDINSFIAFIRAWAGDKQRRSAEGWDRL